jgi:hypothetical protein
VIVDADKPVTLDVQNSFIQAGGQSATWGQGRCLEAELFQSLSDQAIDALLTKALEVREHELVAAHIREKSGGGLTLEALLAGRPALPYSPAARQVLGVASSIRRNGWYKSVATYEYIAKNIIGPDLINANPGFRAIIDRIRDWIHAA